MKLFHTLSGTKFLRPVLFALSLVFQAPCPSLHADEDRPPDIVLILADDLGFSDLGCYGGEIRTPVLDELARNGQRYSQFYNAARCCPSRASLLTGRYPHEAGIGHMTYDAGEPGYRGDLRKGTPTIAEILKEAGYFTAMSGKWHVTYNVHSDSPKDNWPCQRGFDQFFGTLPGHGSFYDPAGLMRNNEPAKPEEGFFYTDAIADNAIGFIEQADDQPLFLYVAFTAPHYPLHAREESIESYNGVYDVGWDAIRKMRHENLIKEGIIPGGTALTPRDPASIPWEEDPHRDWQAHRMQVYAAMVTEMDTAIGRIVESLQSNDRLENSLLVFLSDNGGSNEGHLYNTIERMKKPWVSPVIPESAPDGTPMRAGDWPGEPLGGPATYGSYGPRWANVSNTPFRRHKSWVHEGGIATPCIIHFPRNKTIQPGSVSHRVSHIMDLLASATPSGVIANHQTHTDSRSVLRVNSSDRPLGWEHEGNRAFRMGKWKIVSEFPGTWTTMYPYEKEGRWELYNLRKDRTELNDLSEIHPDRLQSMISAYEDWAERIGVIEWSELEGKKE
ncbi:MAG: arylsulfatase [Verrucomicrobiota bacterium]